MEEGAEERGHRRGAYTGANQTREDDKEVERTTLCDGDGEGEDAGTENQGVREYVLRRPPLGDVVAEARILKLGKRLAVGEVNLMQDGHDDLIAHVTSTYSIPPRGE